MITYISLQPPIPPRSIKPPRIEPSQLKPSADHKQTSGNHKQLPIQLAQSPAFEALLRDAKPTVLVPLRALPTVSIIPAHTLSHCRLEVPSFTETENIDSFANFHLLYAGSLDPLVSFQYYVRSIGTRKETYETRGNILGHDGGHQGCERDGEGKLHFGMDICRVLQYSHYRCEADLYSLGS